MGEKLKELYKFCKKQLQLVLIFINFMGMISYSFNVTDHYHVLAYIIYLQNLLSCAFITNIFYVCTINE